VKEFDDELSRFDAVSDRGGQTDRQTDTFRQQISHQWR